jgi:hypothetical protein
LLVTQLQYSQEYIPERVTKELNIAINNTKKRKHGNLEDCMSSASKVRILEKITAKNRAPLGLFDKGYERTVALPELGHLTKQDVRHRQGATLATIYDECWRTAVFSGWEEHSIPDPGTTTQPDPEGGLASAVQMPGEGEVHVMVEDETGSLTHEEETAIAKEARSRQERHCYTFSLSLNTAIALSLTEHTDVVAGLMTSTQVALTNVADELSALVMKTTLLVSTVTDCISLLFCMVTVTKQSSPLIPAIFFFLIVGCPTRTESLNRIRISASEPLRCHDSFP